MWTFIIKVLWNYCFSIHQYYPYMGRAAWMIPGISIIVLQYIHIFVSYKICINYCINNIKLTFCLQCHIPFSWPFVYIWGSPQVTHQLWGHKHSLESPPFLLTINVPNLYFYRLLQHIFFNNFNSLIINQIILTKFWLYIL